MNTLRQWVESRNYQVIEVKPSPKRRMKTIPFDKYEDYLRAALAKCIKESKPSFT